MFYIVYKTINLVNNKFYIGKHRQTIDPHQFDGYYGSGSQIINAVKKYGKDNFVRETLFVFENETECLLKEEETVAPHLGKSYCYNMRSGGIGGFEHINSIPKEDRPNIKAYRQKVDSGEIIVGGTQNWTEETYNKVRKTGWSKLVEMGLLNPNTWENLTEEQRKERSENLSKKVSGSNNGSYGTKFYYNITTKEKKRFGPEDVIPNGWVSSVDYFESKKKTHWYNDGSKSFLLKIGDPKIQQLGLVNGRL
jgi:hypothetical protein